MVRLLKEEIALEELRPSMDFKYDIDKAYYEKDSLAINNHSLLGITFLKICFSFGGKGEVG